MSQNRNKIRFTLLLSGITIFTLFALSSLGESIINDDYQSFQFFRRQVHVHQFELSKDNCLSSWKPEFVDRMINEMDLSYYVLMDSKLISLLKMGNEDLDNSFIIVDRLWSEIFDFYTGEEDNSTVDIISTLNNLNDELNLISRMLAPIHRIGRIFYYSILAITIIFFLFLLIVVSFLSTESGKTSGAGLASVRNALIQGQEQERLRISLELHDKVAQDLFACRMIIKDITAVSEDENIISTFNKSINLLDSSIQEVRDLSYTLRPPALQAIGLDSAIQSYIDNFSQKIDIPITFKAVGISNKNIDETVSINLYRILQETLNNTSKHAHAEQIDVKLLYTYPYLLLKIDDDGVGFRYVKSEIKVKGRNNLGLPGIYERVSLLGGELIINTGKGEGTKILIKVPLEGNEKV